MSNNNLNFWIDVRSNTLMSGWQTTAQAQQPLVMQGDDLSIDIHMIDNSSGPSVEIPFPANCSLKCAIGSIDRYPTGGYFTFTYGSDSVIIPISSTIVSVNSLINALQSITAAGGVIVSFVNSTTYRLVFNAVGSKLEASINSTTLYPKSISSTRTIIEGTSTVNEIQHLKIRTAPVAYADTFSLKGQPTVAVQELTSSIFRIKLTESPRLGNFTISNGTKTTAAISFNASAADVQSYMLSAGLSVSSNVAGTRYYVVSKPDDNTWDISRTVGAYEALTVTPIGITGFSTMVGELNVNSYEIEDLLAGNSSVDAIIEIELTSGTIVQTVYQGLIKISNDLIDDAIYEPTVLPTAFEDSPHDGILYGRKDGGWSAVVGDGNNIPDYNNGTTYTVGNQVYFQGKLYRMIIAVGGAGYDPVSSPSYWESLSGSNPDLTNYLTKDGGSLNSGAQLDFDNSFGVSSIGPMGAGFYEALGTKNVAIYNDRVEVADGVGNPTIVTTSGITFPDATVQTTAAVTPNLSGYAQLSGATFTGKLNTLAPDATSAGLNIGYKTGTSVPTATVAGDVFINDVYLSYKDANNTQQTVLSSAKANNIFLNATIVGTNTPLTILQSGQVLGAVALSVTGLTTLSNTSSSNANGAVSIFNQSSGPALKVSTGNVTTAEVVVIESNFNAGTALRITNTGNSNSLLIEDSANPDSSSFVVTSTGKVAIGASSGFTGGLYKLSVYGDSAENGLFVSGQINTNSGISSLGKISCNPYDVNYPPLNLGNACASSPLGAVNGDIWITNAASPKLAYKIGGVNYYPTVANAFNTFTGGIAITGASASNPQLQVTQNGAGNAVQITTNGTGNALVVEDETSPDAHSFIVNTGGNVGIGVASGYTPVGKLDVAGSITSTTATAGTNSTVVATTAFVKTAIVPQIINLSLSGFPYSTQIGWNTIVRIDGSSGMYVELPTDAQNNVPIGTQIVFIQSDIGQLDFTPMYGAAVRSAGAKMKTSAQYSVATAIKIAASEWLIAGDLTT